MKRMEFEYTAKLDMLERQVELENVKATERLDSKS